VETKRRVIERFPATKCRATSFHHLDDLCTIAGEIPEPWYGPDPEALNRLIESLHKRRTLVRNLINAFRDSAWSQFPNWAAD